MNVVERLDKSKIWPKLAKVAQLGVKNTLRLVLVVSMELP